MDTKSSLSELKPNINQILSNKKYKTHYKVYGNLSNKWQIPIILIHGGPGATHKYFKPIIPLSQYIGPIIVYDQIGSGKSKYRYKISTLTLKDYVNQLTNLLKHLKIDKCHLLGHSWGTILALEYYLKNPNNVLSIIFYSPTISIKLWQWQANKYLLQMKQNNIADIDIPKQYLNKHIGNIKLLQKYAQTNQNIYKHLWGESEYNVNGYIKNYNKISALKNIDIPIHYICGKYDTASPKIVKYLAKKTPNSTYKIFNNSRHVAHFDEEPAFQKHIVFYFNSFYEKVLNQKFKIFLTQFLKQKKKHKNISTQLITLTILKYKAKHQFEKYNLNHSLKKTISQIDIKKIKIKKLFDLQAQLDYWYYTKLLGYGNKYKPKDKMIKLFISEKKIKKIEHPADAILIYIYIRTLAYCDYNKYKYLLKYIPFLRKKSKNTKEPKYYAYFLTHIILYDTQFGKKNEIPLSSKIALKKLYHFCKYKLKYNRENIDLMGEIILCCKLCNNYNFPLYSKLIQNIIPAQLFSHYHENAVLVAATCRWDNYRNIKTKLSE